MLHFEPKILPFWKNSGPRLKFWATPISFVGNLQQSVRLLQVSASSPYFFNPRRHSIHRRYHCIVCDIRPIGWSNCALCDQYTCSRCSHPAIVTDVVRASRRPVCHWRRVQSDRNEQNSTATFRSLCSLYPLKSPHNQMNVSSRFGSDR